MGNITVVALGMALNLVYVIIILFRYYLYLFFLTHPPPLSSRKEGSFEVPSLLVEKGTE
jgi:hypothetical protein